MKNKFIKILFLSSALILLAEGCTKTPQDNGPVTVIPTSPQIQARMKVEGQFGDKLFNFYADENKNAWDLLKITYPVETKQLTSGKTQVTSINATKPDKKHFWQMFINGQASDLNPIEYKVQNNDLIEWKMSPITK